MVGRRERQQEISDLNTKHWFDAKHANLSGGVSLGSNKSSASTFLEYTIDIPADDNYAFFVRKFWKHGPFRFKFGNGEWQTLENSKLLDTVQLNKHSVSWTPGGYHDLKKGSLTLRIEAVEKYSPFIVDCFILPVYRSFLRNLTAWSEIWPSR